MLDQLLLGGLLFFILLFAVDNFPSWHAQVKINRSFQSELESGMREAMMIRPFSHPEESE